MLRQTPGPSRSGARRVREIEQSRALDHLLERLAGRQSLSTGGQRSEVTTEASTKTQEAAREDAGPLRQKDPLHKMVAPDCTVDLLAPRLLEGVIRLQALRALMSLFASSRSEPRLT